MEIKERNKLLKNEKKRERFVRIVERRVNLVLDNLDSIGKCSNRRNYEYSNSDVNKIFNEIELKVKEIKSMFKETQKNKKRFSLKG